MQVLLVLVPFVVAGLTVIFIAFSGGPAAAREAYLTGGRRSFRIAIPLIYIGVRRRGARRGDRLARGVRGRGGRARTEALSDQQKEGKRLFRETCWSCHNLDAVGAQGVTGPDLDDLGLDRQRVLNAIRRGGTGDGRMPAGLLQGQDAQHVADYVARVAGQ